MPPPSQMAHDPHRTNTKCECAIADRARIVPRVRERTR
jgi:hypothetical protein